MNWQPMSTPPTEAGWYLVWRRNQPDLDMPKIEFAHFHPRSIHGWLHDHKHCAQGWMDETFSDWARVTAPGEEREAKEYTALAVMNDAGEFETEQVIQMTDEFANAILFEDNEDGLGEASISAAMQDNARVVRIRATVEEV